MRTINPEMLKIARESRLLTQKDAASLAQISQGKLSKAENGVIKLSTDDMQSVSSAYDYPLDFFMQPADSSLSSHYYFRRRLTVSDRIIDSILAKIKIYKIIIDRLVSAVELPPCNIGDYDVSIENPDEIARKVRYKFGIERGPIHNLTQLLENNGIIVMKFKFNTLKLDGLSTITERGTRVIFLNSDMPNDRMKFSLAHELGHILMHLNEPPRHGELVEEQADNFASELLMPRGELVNKLNNLNFSNLADLKRYWRVSMRAIIRRALNLNSISQREYRNLQIELSRRGYARKEPIFIQFEKSTLMEDIIDLHKTDLAYSEEELKTLVMLNDADYAQWMHINHTNLANSNILEFTNQ